MVLADDPPPASVGRHAAIGALVGAGLGTLTFLFLELTIDHTDHSMDGIAFVMITVPAAAAGMLVGGMVGIARKR
jgi:hypothetical protein